MFGVVDVDDYYDYREGTGDRIKRRDNIETLFRADFKPCDLSDALRKAGMEDYTAIYDVCLQTAKAVHPNNKAKAEKMAFISSYTLAGGDSKVNQVFGRLNYGLNEGNTMAIRPILSLLHGMLRALRSLPYMQFDVLYRGLKREVKWKKEDVKIWSAFTSMSTSETAARNFMIEGKKGTLISGKGLYGYCIIAYSHIQGEHEVLLEPFQAVKVESISSDDNAVYAEVVDVDNTKPILIDEKRFPEDALIPIPEKFANPDAKHLREALGHHCCGLNCKSSGEIKEAEKHNNEAFKLMETVAKNGSKIAKMNLGNCYYFGVGVEKDERKAHSIWGEVDELTDTEYELLSSLSNVLLACNDKFSLTCKSIDDPVAKQILKVTKFYTYPTPFFFDEHPWFETMELIGMQGVWSLWENLEKNSLVSTIDHNSSLVRDDSLKELAKKTIVPSLYLRWEETDIKPFRQLVTALSGNSSLISLDLRNDMIGADGACLLGRQLRHGLSVVVLELCGNAIGDDGLKDLASAFENNSSLLSLNLRSNDIGDEGMCALSSALEKNSFLTELNLGNNKIGDRGASSLKTALVNKRCALKLLNLGRNVIGKYGNVSLGEALEKNSSITELDLSGNNIGDDGADALSKALKENETLTTLKLNYGGIGDKGARSFESALRVNLTLKHLSLRENDFGEELRGVLQGAKGEGVKLEL